MSRSGYSEDCENVSLWRGAVASAIRGKRGQALLREMLTALDAMPVKRLICGELVTPAGECCALGAVALARGLPTDCVDVHDRAAVAALFGIAPALAAEIEFENDGDFCWQTTTPEQRFTHMRAWVAARLKNAEETPT